MDFDEAIREQAERERRGADLVAARIAERAAPLAKAIKDIEQGVRDVARYLEEHGAPLYQYELLFMKKPGLFGRMYQFPSSAGFVTRISHYDMSTEPDSRSNITNLELLLPDGTMAAISHTDPSRRTSAVSKTVGVDAAQVDYRGQEILGKRVFMDYGGSGRLLVSYNDEPYIPFTTHLAQWSRTYLQHGGRHQGVGLTRLR